MTALILAIVALALDSVGVISMYMSIVSLNPITVYLGLAMVIVGLIFSAIAMSKGKKAIQLDPKDTKSKIGRTLGIIGLVYAIIALIFVVFVIVTIFAAAMIAFS